MAPCSQPDSPVMPPPERSASFLSLARAIIGLLTPFAATSGAADSHAMGHPGVWTAGGMLRYHGPT